MRRTLKIGPLVMLCLLCVACTGSPSPEAGSAQSASPAPGQELTSADQSGAISTPTAAEKPMSRDVLEGTKWPPAELTSGEAMISCDIDYSDSGDGKPLQDLGYLMVLDSMDACRERGVVRLHYKGKISSDFTTLVQRVSAMANRMGIGKRILDIDSAGGQVEDGIRAGDAIGINHWTIWVREGSVCHSACVFILAAGDNRVVSGPVGIHRIIRMSSTATTRAELNSELTAVHDDIKQYFARNGVDIAVADMMMTVPSSALRLLTPEELKTYGLSGSNPAQDDLERIRLLRKCGEDFVHRKEAFGREYERKCNAPGDDVETMNACGLALRERHGFPDKKCPRESPLAELD